MARELLFSVTRKDFKIDTFRSGGKGGQKQNSTESGVRVTHIDSGATAEAREGRSQHNNKKLAFRRCVETTKFKLWMDKKAADMLIDKEQVERKVRRSMRPDNIKQEVFNGKTWEEFREGD